MKTLSRMNELNGRIRNRVKYRQELHRRKGVVSMEYEYYLWLIDSIDPLGTARDYYQPVLEELYLRDFEWGNRFQDDSNRASDGLVLREIFANGRGMPLSEIGIDWKPCSCLEMMIGIARRIEFEILAMPGEEDIPKWFWRFIENLGLVGFREKCGRGAVGNSVNGVGNGGVSEYEFIDNRINDWLNRKYSKDGTGGIFVVRDSYFDMRRMPIWKQMSAVLNESDEMDF